MATSFLLPGSSHFTLWAWLGTSRQTGSGRSGWGHFFEQQKSCRVWQGTGSQSIKKLS
jgi:hypothetical protein